MASRVEYAVSMTPIRTISGSGADYDDHDAIATDIGKSLGGSGEVATTSADHTTVGYASKTVAYANAAVSGGAALQLGADAADYKMVFIKNTGKKYSSPTALGADTTSTTGLVVTIEAVAAGATTKFTIPKGGAVCLPQVDLGTAMGIFVQSDSATETIAVEYALVL